MFPGYRNIDIAQYQGLQNDLDEETGVGWGKVEEPTPCTSCLLCTYYLT